MNDRPGTRIALVFVDLVAFFAALNLAIYMRYSGLIHFAKMGEPPWHEIFLAFPVVAAVWLIVNGLLGSYRARQSTLEEISTVIRGTLLTFLAVLSTTFFYRGFSYSRAMMGFWVPSVLLLVMVGRLSFRALRRRVFQRFAGRSRVAILGQSKVGQSLIRALATDHDFYQVVGLIAVDAKHRSNASDAEEIPEGITMLGNFDDIEKLCQSNAFDSLLLVERGLKEDAVLLSIENCLRYQINWSMVPAVHELLLDRARVDLVDGIPLVGMRRSNIVGFNWAIKRLLDIAATSLLLLLASPLMLFVAIAIKLSSPGPVFYVQERIGYRGQRFPFFKFRSMHLGNNDAIHREYTKRWITENQAHTEDAQQKVHKITDDPRVFPMGKWIRRFSIDELPQLINVLRGEMSLIGPRPALPYEVEVYREWHRRRFEAPPGITGLWQVSGRNRLSFEEMIKLDIDYLENWSLLLDLQILWRTVRVVLFEHAY